MSLKQGTKLEYEHYEKSEHFNCLEKKKAISPSTNVDTT